VLTRPAAKNTKNKLDLILRELDDRTQLWLAEPQGGATALKKKQQQQGR